MYVIMQGRGSLHLQETSFFQTENHAHGLQELNVTLMLQIYMQYLGD